MLPSMITIVYILLSILSNNENVKLQSTDNVKSVSGRFSRNGPLNNTEFDEEFGSLQTLADKVYSLEDHIYEKRNFKNVFGHFIPIGGIPERIRTLFSEIFPFVRVLNKTEMVTDGNLTKKCCERYGCFTTDPPFGISNCRMSALLPLCQDDLKVRFFLWTRNNRHSESIIDPEKSSSLTNSPFVGGTDVIIFIHGSLGAANISIITEMKDIILDKTDCMFFSVDWKIGARMNYTKSVANAEVVSAITAYFIQQIQEQYNVDLDKFHIIGSSLGAHIAGGVGKRVPGIGRITGLDPAKILFEGCDSTLRLTKSDAKFVDVIHTDIYMIGIATPSGHLDIYIHGGAYQPACFGLQGCDHPMALEYFIDSIEAKCPYYAYQCDSYDDFMKGKCDSECTSYSSLCAPMGYHADKWKRHAKMSPTLMFMAAGESRHYCVYHYYIELKCTDENIRMWRYGLSHDDLSVNVIGEDGETGYQYIHRNSIQYTTLPRISTIITSEHQIGKIQSIKIKWFHHESYGRSPPMPDDCHNDSFEEVCCGNIKNNSAVDNLCCTCPYAISFVYVRNMETNYRVTFDGRRKILPPFEEVLFDEKIECNGGQHVA